MLHQDTQEIFFNQIEECIKQECQDEFGYYSGITESEIKELAKNLFEMAKEWKTKV